MVARAVVVTAEGMADQDCIRFIGIQFSVRFIPDRQFPDLLSVFKFERICVVVLLRLHESRAVRGFPRFVCGIFRHLRVTSRHLGFFTSGACHRREVIASALCIFEEGVGDVVVGVDRFHIIQIIQDFDQPQYLPDSARVGNLDEVAGQVDQFG